MVEGQPGERPKRDPLGGGRIVPRTGSSGRPSDVENHRNRVLPRVAAGVGVDPQERTDSAAKAGLLSELPKDRCFDGLADFDEPARESPRATKGGTSPPDEEYPVPPDPHRVDREGRAGVSPGHRPTNRRGGIRASLPPADVPPRIIKSP